jgi:lysophospholipase L1-like esterase
MVGVSLRGVDGEGFRRGPGRQSSRRFGPIAAAVIAAALLLGAAGGATAGPCAAPEAVTRFSAPMPAMRRAFETGAPVRIVAFGSSSTEGAGASARERTYPARLAAALRRSFPGRSFQVINRGKGGELAIHMLARLERDVVAEAPTLVIWQTGVNDAIRGVAMPMFAATVSDGLARLRAADIDVVLLDQQYYPKAAAVKNYSAYLALVRRLGAEHEVPVFRRYELMEYLVESGQFRIEDLLAPDRFHQNDLSYDCLGSVIAEAFKVRFGASGGSSAMPRRASVAD